jgi:branched-subunit amino acid ABC-type transport system permease component
MDIVPQLILNSIIAGAIYTMIALGFNLIYGTTKFFDLGYGSFIAIGGYSVLFFYRTLGFNLYISIPLGIFIAGLVGFVVYRLIYSTLRSRKSSNMVLLVASLGVLTTIQAIIAIFFTSQFHVLSLKNSSNPISIFGGVITQTQLVTFILGIAVMVLIATVFRCSLFGKTIKAIGDDEEVSRIVGINTNNIIGWVFFIGSAIGGLAGILIGFDTGVEPMMGLSFLLKGMVASIIGGIGNVYGSVLGAFLLAFIENFGIWKISGEWKDAVAFSVLIVFLLFRPQGVLKR